VGKLSSALAQNVQEKKVIYSFQNLGKGKKVVHHL